MCKIVFFTKKSQAKPTPNSFIGDAENCSNERSMMTVNCYEISALLLVFLTVMATVFHDI